VRFDSGLGDHRASPSYPRASNAADGRPFFARGPDGSCVRHGTQRSPSSDLPTGHLVRTATAFGRSHSHPPRPGHRHSVRVLLSSPEAPPALRTSSSSHCRKEQQRERKEEEPRKILPPPSSSLIALRSLLASLATRLASTASISQRRSGGAGPPFAAAASGRCYLHDAGYLRHRHCRYATKCK
jgi:hypothetical protein